VFRPHVFFTARSLEQIKKRHMLFHVRACSSASAPAWSYGALGTTHHSLHDLAVLRAIHNITIIIPADNFETREAIRYAAKTQKPVYVRFGKAPMPDLHRPGTNFATGRALTLREGADMAFIATGETVVHALLAACQLAEQGRQARVISMHHDQAAGH